MAEPTEREWLEGLRYEDKFPDCEHAGHEWAPAGGGLLICLRCEAEKWEDER